MLLFGLALFDLGGAEQRTVRRKHHYQKDGHRCQKDQFGSGLVLEEVAPSDAIEDRHVLRKVVSEVENMANAGNGLFEFRNAFLESLLGAWEEN